MELLPYTCGCTNKEILHFIHYYRKSLTKIIIISRQLQVDIHVVLIIKGKAEYQCNNAVD